MKKLLWALFTASFMNAGISNGDLSQRFGPDSHIYNTPLYFDRYRCIDSSRSHVKKRASHASHKEHAKKIKKRSKNKQ